jgi:hypothetical protein
MPPKAQHGVRTHTRTNADGTKTTVHQHSRASKGRKPGAPLVSPRHALKLARQAFAAGRRKRRWTAAALGALALAEIMTYLTVQGAALLFVTVGVLALATATVAASATGSAPAGSWRKPAAKKRTRRRT